MVCVLQHPVTFALVQLLLRVKSKKAEIGVGGNCLHTSIKTWMFIYQSRHLFDIPGSDVISILRQFISEHLEIFTGKYVIEDMLVYPGL